jgi:hypothetical protein
MKTLISTYCNRYKGDFLIHHWLKSLQANVNLAGIDIMVIDFGLTDEQVKLLKDRGVIVNKQEPEKGRMSNYQYKFLGEYLKAHPEYKQVLYSDCGDLIFQKDISHLFSICPDQLRLVPEPGFNYYLHRLTLGFQDVKKEKIKDIKKVLGAHSTCNCGFVIGPAHLIASVWDFYTENCNAADVHGTDQLIINYLAYKNGFEKLPGKYNYVTFLKTEKISKDTTGFYTLNGEVLPVVHNAGRYNFARAITDFGYMQGTSKKRTFIFLISACYRVLDKFARIIY